MLFIFSCNCLLFMCTFYVMLYNEEKQKGKIWWLQWLYYLCITQQNAVNVERVSAIKDITGQETATDILRAVDKEAANIPSKDMVKIVLTGHYTVDTEKDFTYFDQAMEGRFYFLKWKDESRLSIDYKSYENMISLKGEFVRTVMNTKEEESEKEQMILLGIRALSGEDLGV